MRKNDAGDAVKRRLFNKNAKLDASQVKDLRTNTSARKMLVKPLMGDHRTRIMTDDAPVGMQDFINYPPSTLRALQKYAEQVAKDNGWDYLHGNTRRKR